MDESFEIMPTARKTKNGTTKGRSRRYYRRRSAFPSKALSIPRWKFGSGVPAGIRMNMKYSDRYTFEDTMSNFMEWTWRANSIFDPDETGTGHQPNGFDQMAALYEKYIVLGSSMTIWVADALTGSQAANITPTQVAICRKATSTPLDMNQTKEQPISRWCLIQFGAPNMLHVPYSQFWRTEGFPGTKNSISYAASTAGNPAQVEYYGMIAERGGQASIDTRVCVVINYDVWFFDRKDLSLS